MSRASFDRSRPLKPIHIVAMGSRTPLGLTAESSAAAVRGRISRVAEHPFIVDLRGRPLRMARDARLDPGLFGAARMLELARSALDEVAQKLGSGVGPGPIPIAVGMPEARAGFSEPEARRLSAEIARTSTFRVAPQLTFAMEGHAGVLHAVEVALGAINKGACDLMVVGGVDSYLHPDTLLALDARSRLAAETVRLGFCPGEGACFVALAREHGRASLGLPSLARVVGAHSSDQGARGSRGVTPGEALAEALVGAAGPHTQAQDKVDEVFCDINGERRRTEEWGFAVLRTQDMWRDPAAYRTPVSEWGDTGAATGALLMTLAVWAGARNFAKGPRAMIWTGSDGGLRSAALLSHAEA